MTMSWLIDSSVLVSSYDEAEEQHKVSYALVEKAMAGEISACVAQQNLLEFIAVVTSPKRVAHPLSLGDALSKVADYIACFELISPGGMTFFTFEELLRAYPAIRERVFDVYLAATALDNGVEKMCTWNTRHLGNIRSLTVRTPVEVLQGSKRVREKVQKG